MTNRASLESRRLKYTSGERNFNEGDQVTVTLSNGCRANGAITNRTPKIDIDTGEPVYTVRITSGSLKGANYYARESQLAPGWVSTAAIDESCGSGGAAQESGTSSAWDGAVDGVIKMIANPYVLATLVALALVVWGARQRTA